MPAKFFRASKWCKVSTVRSRRKPASRQDVERAFVIARSRVWQRALLTGFAIFLLMGGMISMMWSGGVDVIEGRMTGGELGCLRLLCRHGGHRFRHTG